MQLKTPVMILTAQSVITIQRPVMRPFTRVRDFSPGPPGSFFDDQNILNVFIIGLHRSLHLLHLIFKRCSQHIKLIDNILYEHFEVVVRYIIYYIIIYIKKVYRLHRKTNIIYK